MTEANKKNTVWIPAKQHKKLKLRAVKKGTTIEDEIELILNKEFKEK